MIMSSSVFVLTRLSRRLLDKSQWNGSRFSVKCRNFQTHGNGVMQKIKKPPNFRNSPKEDAIGVGGYLLLIAPISTFCLGVWQTNRRSWKLDLIENLNKKKKSPPVDLPESVPEIEALEYEKVKVRGRFDHSRELFIGPRSLVAEDAGGGLLSSGDNVGWHVVTPFRLADRPGEEILVNRGWVSRKSMNPAVRQAGQIEGEVELTGVVRVSEPRQQFTPKNQVDSNRWMSRDVQALAEKLGTSPIFIDADEKSTVSGGPIGGQTRVTLRNDHFSYMLTWYSLSAATLYMWVKKFVVRR